MKLIVVATLVAYLLMASGVKADDQYGAYGSSSETPSEQPREEVVHSTVNAGFGDNLVADAAMVGALGVLLFAVSRLTKRVYLFEK